MPEAKEHSDGNTAFPPQRNDPMLLYRVIHVLNVVANIQYSVFPFWFNIIYRVDIVVMKSVLEDEFSPIRCFSYRCSIFDQVKQYTYLWTAHAGYSTDIMCRSYVSPITTKITNLSTLWDAKNVDNISMIKWIMDNTVGWSVDKRQHLLDSIVSVKMWFDRLRNTRVLQPIRFVHPRY